jgi:hydroxymethylpyrimidine/phosphomethylpyrimidine kinase
MDLAVFAELGAVGVAAVAAVTAQNSKRVAAVEPLSAKIVTRQLEAVWEQVRPDAVCIGLLPDAAGMRAVGKFLSRLSPRPRIVIDPVLASTSGYEFLAAREIRQLLQLLPLADVVTPNLREASRLTSLPVTSVQTAQAAARKLTRYGCAALVTGGHLPGGRCVDVLVQGDYVRRFSASRLEGTVRGAGGILAAAIAVQLARGATLERAVAQARTFVRHAIKFRGAAQFNRATSRRK